MENLSIHLEPLRAFLFQIGAYLPRVLLAVAVVVVGWLVAKAARFTVVRGLHAINFHVLTGRAGIDNFLRQGGMATDTSGVLAMLAYWLIILASLTIAFNTLGLAYVTDLLSRVLWFIPNVIVALVIVAFGAYFARFVGDAVSTFGRQSGMQDSMLLGKLAQGAIMLFVVLIALDQVKVGGDIVRQSFLIILAGVVFALALAFGLAGRDWAADRIQEWWPRRGGIDSRTVRPPEVTPDPPPAGPGDGPGGVRPTVAPIRRPAATGTWPDRSGDPQDRAHP
ncbi:hypothetical protein [Variovorax sp. OV329]|uniref:mechanosensitive ion channel family protein n=1 Tax=Variovorax sp. OV329 TaxID=1882825 RepID=UPI0008F26D99|nr:Conserved TM helix [Variovorax sp. OV329]